MSAGYCPNCPCGSCVQARSTEDFWRQSYNQQAGFPVSSEPECAFERIAKEYAARGQPMPSSLLLYCGCRKCSPICW